MQREEIKGKHPYLSHLDAVRKTPPPKAKMDETASLSSSAGELKASTVFRVDTESIDVTDEELALALLSDMSDLARLKLLLA